jgi:predicted lipoprotein with Yx(FWY)xxD motif
MFSVVMVACGSTNGNPAGSQVSYEKASNGKQVAVKASGDEVAKIQVLTNDQVGKYLADGKGMTLYYYTKDEPGVSRCTAGCLQSWPAFYGDVNHLKVPNGFNKADFGTLKRDDTGRQQITFKGYPLYYYVPDQQKGDVNGQGIGGVWYIVNSNTIFKSTQGDDKSSSKTTSDNGNGY